MKTIIATSIAVWTLGACADVHAPGSHGQSYMHDLRARLSRSAEGLVIEHRANGITKIDLKGRFDSVTMRTADGRTACVDSQAALDRMLGVEP